MRPNFEPVEGPACDDRAMTDHRPHQLGTGPLTVGRVIGDALAMLHQSFARIAGVAIVFFAVPALIAGVVVEAITLFIGSEEPLIIVAAISSLFAAASLRILGPVAFAGFLDEAVAKQYLHGDRSTLGEVMRRLPWKPLIAADLIVLLFVGLGLSLLIVPGLVIYGLVGIVGPVVVQERAGVRASLGRAVHLSLSAPRLVTVLVVVPFAFEELLHSVIFQTIHDYGIGIAVLAEWLVAIVVGGTLGLLEVALAAELMARNPRTGRAALLDDGQASAVRGDTVA